MVSKPIIRLIRCRINTTCSFDFQYGTVSLANTTTSAIGNMVPFQLRASRPVLLAMMAQAFEFYDGDAAVFEPQQAFLLQPLQALVGILPRNSGERSDFLLRDLEMAGQVRIENRIEQRGDGARNAAGGIERATVFQRPDELADPLVELPNQKAVERDAVLEQPEEGATVHQRQPCIAQRHHIVTARLALEHGALPEPGPR